MENRLIGGALFIAGTAIGAGMLAMPLACANLGFPLSALLLIALWSITAYSALLLLEVLQHHDVGCGLVTLAACYLGRTGYWLIHGTLLLLLYSLMAAYLTAGGEQLANQLSHWLLPVTSQQGSLLLTLLIALIISNGPQLTDASNRLFFILKIGVFFALLLLLAPHSQPQKLLIARQQSTAWLTAVPILFTAFGFHASLPSIAHYLPQQFSTRCRVILTGSAIPLLCYLLWLSAIQGLINTENIDIIPAVDPGIPELLAMIKRLGVPSYITGAITLFAALALLTSLLGVALGLFDHWLEHVSRKSRFQQRVKAILYTFSPPLLFADLYPQGFIMALGYAALALAILALVLPVALTWKNRQKFPQGTTISGGKWGLLITLCTGISIIVLEIAIRSGIWRTTG